MKIKYVLKSLLYDALLISWGYYSGIHNFSIWRICLGFVLFSILGGLLITVLGKKKVINVA
jgi:hypothetical protein